MKHLRRRCFAGLSCIASAAAVTVTVGATVSACTGPTGPVEGVAIHAIQGADHRSPLEGRRVTGVVGVVTAHKAERKGGQLVWLQSLDPDDMDATSEAISVATREAHHEVSVGDRVAVSGMVEERGWEQELTVTRIVADTVEILESDCTLPEPVAIGKSGRTVPADHIDDDGLTVFQPDEDAIDFFESLEGMRVSVEKASVVGPTSRYGEVAVLADSGAGSEVRSARGGIMATNDDKNPEILLIDDELVEKAPLARVGDRFAATIVGVMDYRFGAFRIYSTEVLPEPSHGGLKRGTSALDDALLTVATFNVENLSFVTSQRRFEQLARLVVRNLRSPAIVAVQEIQDDSGPQDDGVVSAGRTLDRLVESVAAAGGPRYQWRQIDPSDNHDGGAPGANIRVALLFDPKRVDFVDRGNGGEAKVVEGPALSSSPGRVAPDHPAFNRDRDRGLHGCRKSLAGEFRFRGESLFVINNHLSSKGGDDSLFGARQPPVPISEKQRTAQAEAIAEIVRELLARDAEANVIVLGDLNEFEYRPPLQALERVGLTNLIKTLDLEERYTYVFRGNSQVLDHILVSPSLAATAEVDVVHVNAEFAAARRASDHDAVVASFNLP